MRYRAVVSYFGKDYVGWQRQLNGTSSNGWRRR